MAGWIRLHRKMLQHGHLRMPAPALKVWIYFLLKASPWPSPQKDLESGELWTSYREIQEVLSEKNKKMGEHTISKALNYLQKGGYIDLEVKDFYGIKVKIINWTTYQSTGSEPTANTAAITNTTANAADTIATVTANTAATTANTIASTTADTLAPTIAPATAVTAVDTTAACAVMRTEKPSNGAGLSSSKNNKNYKNFKKLKNTPSGAEREHLPEAAYKITSLLEAWQHRFVQKFGARPQTNRQRDAGLFREMLQYRTPEEILELMELFFNSQDPWIQNSGYTVGTFKSQINKLLARREQTPHLYRGNEAYIARLAQEYL